jgi:hypothetical protein
MLLAVQRRGVVVERLFHRACTDPPAIGIPDRLALRSPLGVSRHSTVYERTLPCRTLQPL